MKINADCDEHNFVIAWKSSENMKGGGCQYALLPPR